MERPFKPGKLVWRQGRKTYVFLTHQDNEDLPCCAVFWTSNHVGPVSSVIRNFTFPLLCEALSVIHKHLSSRGKTVMFWVFLFRFCCFWQSEVVTQVLERPGPHWYATQTAALTCSFPLLTPPKDLTPHRAGWRWKEVKQLWNAPALCLQPCSTTCLWLGNTD